MIDFLRVAVLLVALVIWGVMGFIFWIPFLIRQIAVFSVLILHATLTNQDPSAAGVGLDLAVTFYANGFRKIISAMYREGHSNSGGGMEFRPGRFIGEMVWTAMFWLTTLFATGLLDGLITRIGTAIRSAAER